MTDLADLFLLPVSCGQSSAGRAFIVADDPFVCCVPNGCVMTSRSVMPFLPSPVMRPKSSSSVACGFSLLCTLSFAGCSCPSVSWRAGMSLFFVFVLFACFTQRICHGSCHRPHQRVRSPYSRPVATTDPAERRLFAAVAARTDRVMHGVLRHSPAGGGQFRFGYAATCRAHPAQT